MANEPDQIEQWLTSCTNGDRGALENLLLHFHDPLMSFVRSLVVGPVAQWTTADDLMQETLMEAFRRASSLEVRGGDAFFAWLKAIARTRLINQIEARNAAKRGGGVVPAKAAAGTNDTAQTILQMIAGSDPTPSLIARRHELERYLSSAIRQLDPERAQVLELRYGSGLAIADVAVRLGKTESAVKMMISRTIDELRAKLSAVDPNFSIST